MKMKDWLCMLGLYQLGARRMGLGAAKAIFK
jgi:hypothetical protein